MGLSSEEIWVPIQGYEGSYEVSSFGRVKSNKRVVVQSNGHPMTFPERILKPNVSDSGYLYVTLTSNKGHVAKRVHRLVAEAFIQNPSNKPQVHHINHIKSDDCVENLKWVTSKENISYELKRITYNRDSHGRFSSGNVRGKIKMVFVLTNCTGVIAVYSNKENARADKAKFEDRMPSMRIVAVPYRKHSVLD